jgi:hypothetical protein
VLLLVVLASARGSSRAVCLPSGNWGSSPHTVTLARLAPYLGSQCHLRNENDAITSYVIVEADICLRLLHTSKLGIYKGFEQLICCLKGVWVNPYTVTLAKPAPDLGTHGPFIVSLLIVIFAVDCDIFPSLPSPESSKQSLLLPVDIVLPLVFAHRCCFKQPSALDAPVNGWLLCHLSYHTC